MIKTLLPNCRWLLLASEHQGEDWAQLSTSIDRQLEAMGMELAEETVFIMAGPQETLVARAVIGPKKAVAPPLRLLDWVAAPVYRKVLSSSKWPDLWQECERELGSIQSQNGRFMLAVKRRLQPELGLSIELLIPA